MPALKKIFLHCMSKIKAVHSRFSYYITWGKEIGDANGENSKEERSMIGGLGLCAIKSGDALGEEEAFSYSFFKYDRIWV